MAFLFAKFAFLDNGRERRYKICCFPIFFSSIFGQLTNNFCLGLRPQPHLKRDLIEVLFNKDPQVVVVAGTLFVQRRRLRGVGVARRPHDNSVKHLSGLEFEVPKKR